MTVFLTATWRDLLMLNYRVPAQVLQPHVPRGTELDVFQDKVLVSMVGFLFQDTRLKGVPVPFHRHFEEVNLRFYVRRRHDDELRRGVVFIKELVPKRALALVARLAYGENYVALPMWHRPRADGDVAYGWRTRAGDHEMSAVPHGPVALPPEGSEAQFITEHYWGYSRRRDGGTTEYRVAHPPWTTAAVRDVRFSCDVAGLYGAAFAPYLSGPPDSAFLADGSDVSVYAGRTLT